MNTKTPAPWMLVTSAGAAGMAVQLSAHVAEGTRGNAVRRIDVQDGSVDLGESAEIATRLVYDILQREKYLYRQIIVRYESDTSLINVHGRSADLAFAIALAMAVQYEICERRDIDIAETEIAATGMLGDDGAVLPVEGIAEKLAAALAVLPPRSRVLLPGGTERDLPAEIRRQAEERGIALVPVSRIEEALKHIGITISRTWLDCPFRGLEPFEYKHASVFFGREKEIEDILSLLDRRAAKGPACVVVRGPSGSGKSSLVQAGVIAALLRRGTHDGDTKRYRWGMLRRRDAKADIDPIRERQALAAALYDAWRHDEPGGLGRHHRAGETAGAFDAAAFLAWLDTRHLPLDQNASAGVVDRLAWAANTAAQGAIDPPERTRYVFVLDQLEEWFTAPLQPALIEELCTFMARLAERGVWLIATMTNTAAPLLAKHPALAASFGVEGEYVLNQQRGATNLEAVIREPAKAAGLRFESGLDAEIFAASNHGGVDVLPLLELLLTELYERRDPAHNELRFSDYREVGGLDGVVSARAEAAFHQCAPAAQSMMPQLLWRLATAGEFVASHYATESPIHALVAAFSEKRLLVQDQSIHGFISVRAAHDALLRHWSRAVEQRRNDEADIPLWLDIARESRQWARGERALIPSGPQLQAALALSRRRQAFWNDGDRPVLDYITRSAQQRSRRRVLSYVAWGIPALIAAGAGLKGAYDYVESLYITRITFNDASMPDGTTGIAADPYLHHKGISVVSREPENSTMVIKSSLGLYGGRAVDSTSSGNVLTQEVGDQTAPISFTLRFAEPIKRVRLRRAALWPATGSGVTHPAWKAVALDESFHEISTVREPLLAEYRDIPAETYELESAADKLIHLVRITSDYRNEKGIPFAGFHAVLISEIDLIH
jgi:hypothetical protein